MKTQVMLLVEFNCVVLWVKFLKILNQMVKNFLQKIMIPLFASPNSTKSAPPGFWRNNLSKEKRILAPFLVLLRQDDCLLVPGPNPESFRHFPRKHAKCHVEILLGWKKQFSLLIFAWRLLLSWRHPVTALQRLRAAQHPILL